MSDLVALLPVSSRWVNALGHRPTARLVHVHRMNRTLPEHGTAVLWLHVPIQRGTPQVIGTSRVVEIRHGTCHDLSESLFTEVFEGRRAIQKLAGSIYEPLCAVITDSMQRFPSPVGRQQLAQLGVTLKLWNGRQQILRVDSHQFQRIVELGMNEPGMVQDVDARFNEA